MQLLILFKIHVVLIVYLLVLLKKICKKTTVAYSGYRYFSWFVEDHRHKCGREQRGEGCSRRFSLL